MSSSCCAAGSNTEAASEYEVARIEKAKNSCHLCEEYSERQKIKPIVVMCCEGACLRGEIARQAANILCYSLAPEKTARICLGGAFTKNSGQRSLVAHATRLIALEGCFFNCSSRMMRGVIDGLQPEVIVTDQLYPCNRELFGLDEMPAEEIQRHARTVAQQIAAKL